MSFWAHNFSSFFFFLKYLLASCLNCSGKTHDWPLQSFPCLQLLWPLHSSVVSLFPWLWRVLKSLRGMADLQGTIYMVKVGQVLVICHAATKTHATCILQGYWKHPEDLHFLLAFSFAMAKHRSWAYLSQISADLWLSICVNALNSPLWRLLTWAYRVLTLLHNHLSEDLQRMLYSMQTPSPHPSESENSGRENPWDGNSVICAGAWSKQAAALPAGRRQRLGASVARSQQPDRRQPHGFGKE